MWFLGKFRSNRLKSGLWIFVETFLLKGGLNHMMFLLCLLYFWCLFNRNNRNKIKVSYSCMQNIKSIRKNHNIKVLNNTAETEESCNCRNKNNFPLDGKCLTPNIIYEAQITSNQLDYKQKIYIGTAETGFKHRFNNPTRSFNLEHYENDRTI